MTDHPSQVFVEFYTSERYAIGRHFRPAVAHLPRKLTELEVREGWRLIACIDGYCFLFYREQSVADIARRTYKVRCPADLESVNDFLKEHDCVLYIGSDGRLHLQHVGTTYTSDIRIKIASTLRLLAEDMIREIGHTTWPNKRKEQFFAFADRVSGAAAELEGDSPPRLFPETKLETVANTKMEIEPLKDQSVEDDPINPKHYGGRDCADIGERLSANGYQILKYCWRLGEKDDPCVELGKALWYANSEMELCRSMTKTDITPFITPNRLALEDPDAFLNIRLEGRNAFVQCIARCLWEGYSNVQLRIIINLLEDKLDEIDCRQTSEGMEQ